MENQTIDSFQQQQQPIATEQPKPSYNPLLDNVSEKPYSMGSVSATQEQLTGSIPEPLYQPQSVGGRENPYKKIREGGVPNSSSSDSEPPPINPSVNQLSDSDKKEGAKHLTKLILDGYEQLHVFANQSLQFSQRKLRKLEAEGEIDLSIPIPDGYGSTITSGGFIQEFNEQTKDTLVVTPQFKKEVSPIMERVLAKRGASLTDEQMLMYLFGKDIAIKGFIVYQVRGQMNDMIQVIKDQTAAFKSGQSFTPPPKNDAKTRDNVTTKPYAHAPVTPEPIVPMNSETFNFDTNESVLQSKVQTMAVPKTGRDRAIAQRQKEKKWKEDAEAQNKPSASYQEALSQRKTGKRGRAKKTVSDYVKGVDKEEITNSIILEPSKPDGDNPSVNEIL